VLDIKLLGDDAGLFVLSMKGGGLEARRRQFTLFIEYFQSSGRVLRKRCIY
jgi:hypothetical protein